MQNRETVVVAIKKFDTTPNGLKAALAREGQSNPEVSGLRGGRIETLEGRNGRQEPAVRYFAG